MSLMHRIIAVGIVFIATLIALPDPEPKHHKGVVILVGGGDIPTEAIDWMKSKSPLKQYIVVTCDPVRSERWNSILGCVSFVLPEQLTEAALNGIAGLVIDGGDQWNYLQRLNGYIIGLAHNRGISVLGTSAGAMILGEHFFTAEKDTITSEEALADERVCVGRGFAKIDLLEGIFVDTHYSERNRAGRLGVFLEKSGAMFGLGIDEATALCIENGKCMVFGQKRVNILKHKLCKSRCIFEPDEIINIAKK